jgi:hypothetical protein
LFTDQIRQLLIYYFKITYKAYKLFQSNILKEFS